MARLFSDSSIRLGKVAPICADKRVNWAKTRTGTLRLVQMQHPANFCVTKGGKFLKQLRAPPEHALLPILIHAIHCESYSVNRNMKPTKQTNATMPLPGNVGKKKKKTLRSKTSNAGTVKNSKEKAKRAPAKKGKSTKAEAGKSSSAGQEQSRPVPKTRKKSSSVRNKMSKSSKAGKGQGTSVKKSKNSEQAPSTPVRRKKPTILQKKTKQPSSPSTPSTMTSQSTSSSKHMLEKMTNLQIKKKLKMYDEANEFNPGNAATIDWLNLSQVRDALIYHGQGNPDLESLDFHESIVLLCKCFKPHQIRPVYQGVCQEAGWDWRSLDVARHKSMKKLASEFASSCVDIVNAMKQVSVPGNIACPKEHENGQANA